MYLNSEIVKDTPAARLLWRNAQVLSASGAQRDVAGVAADTIWLKGPEARAFRGLSF